jgi:ketosteroid isomerase-like protein
MTRTDLARQYLERSTSSDVDGALALLTDDVVLDRPMLGVVSGKEAVAEAMRNRPPGLGGMTPTFDEPVEQGEQVKVPVTALVWTFSFTDDKISRIAVELAM